MEHSQIRLIVFLSVLFIMFLWESVAPLRAWKNHRGLHWLNNMGLVVLNTVLLRLLVPTAVLSTTVWIEREKNIGLFALIPLPGFVQVILGVILLDLVIYAQHLLFHQIPFLWRLHRVHHTDRDYDVTTGARFHPVEIFFSLGIKIGAIALLGVDLKTVFFFEIILNASAMFNHGNIGLPRPLDLFLRFFLVTPDMHRIHHSIVQSETDSNYGFFLPWWDRLFGTYTRDSEAGELFEIGLSQYTETKDTLRIDGMLKMPFTIR